MKRRVCWVLALILIPVLIVTGPGAPSASAATTYGDPAPWSVQWNRYPTAQGLIKCNAVSQWVLDGSTQSVRTTMKCKPGPIVIGDVMWDVRLMFSGHSVVNGVETGTVCNLQTPTLDEQDLSNTTFTVTASQGGPPHISPVYVPAPVVSRCSVDTVCYYFLDDTNLLDDKEHDGCTTAGPGGPGGIVGAPGTTAPVAGGVCAYGLPTRPQQPAQQPLWTNFAARWGWTQPWTTVVNAASSAPGVARWHMYLMVRLPGGRTTVYYAGGQHVPLNAGQSYTSPVTDNYFPNSAGALDLSPGSAGSVFSTAYLSDTGSSGQASSFPISGEVVGVGVLGFPHVTTANQGWPPRSSPTSTTKRAPTPATIQMDPDYGALGVNDPGKCQFYWGDKISDDANSVTIFDEPADSLAPSPVGNETPIGDDDVADPEEEEGCDFKLTDPTTWLSGGMCVVTGLLGGIFDKLGDIFGKLKALAEFAFNFWAKMLGFVIDLFLPSAGFFEDKVDEVKDAWSDTPPVVVVDTFADVGDTVSTTSTACAGPELPLNMPMLEGGYKAVSLRPFSSCADWSSRLATITRTVLTLGAYLGAFLLCIRILAASIGLQFSFGNGDD